MKILIINTVYGTGSTGRICAHLYEYAKKSGHLPYIGYGRNEGPDGTNSFKIGNHSDFFLHVLSNFFHGNSGFASAGVTRKFLKWIDLIHPDLIHLHNIHGFYLNVPLLFEYIKARDIPVIWTLHDCWPLTGQCAYFDYAGCDKWKTQCHHCPQFRTSYPYSLFKDNSRQNYLNKRNAFLGVPRLTIVTPSKWLAGLVSQSFLAGYQTRVIPNGIDTSVFHPTKGYPVSSPYILGVANVWDTRKGLRFFLELADLLDDNTIIVLIGINSHQQKQIAQKTNGRILCINRTNNQQELALYYSSALAFLNPTLEDNFPTTNLEALACGTPVITFETGGSPEAISEDCGIIVQEKSATALYNALKSLASNPLISSASCRQRALEYNCESQYLQYINLYESMVSAPAF